jgi:hypothetical protein
MTEAAAESTVAAARATQAAAVQIIAAAGGTYYTNVVSKIRITNAEKRPDSRMRAGYQG